MSYERIILGVAAVFVFTGAGICFAGVITVNWDGSADYTTIQPAIDVAVNGDTIIVDVGTYVENINFRGKNIILTSTNPDDWGVVENTIIQGTGTNSVVTFAGTETAECELAGFTITGGYTTGHGGGIQAAGASVTISRCIIRNNTAEGAGGAIQWFFGEISRCIVRNNEAYAGGAFAGCFGPIVNCVVSGNSAEVGGAFNNCDGDIVNCTVTANIGGAEGAVRACDGTITNCIVWGNSLDGFYNCTADITYCCYAGATGEGNIDAEPLFIDAVGGDYHLFAWSPCVDRGTNTPAGGLSEFDLDGNTRLIDGDNDSVVTVDMGTYEAAPIAGAYMIVSDTELDFTALEGSGNPESQVITVRNAGINTLFWEITEDRDWLSVSPETGESTGEEDEVVVSVDITGLSSGEYICDLTISAPDALNSPQVVTVELCVRDLDLDEGLWVPYEYPTIQAAIDAAINGEVVIVADGVYTGDGNRDIDFMGKAITVRSENGPENCIIDCQGTEQEPHRGFNFFNGENTDSILSGITITNGYADKGGGVYCGENSSPTIDNCIISGNSSTSFLGGSGIYCIDNSPDISNCTISYNIDLHFEDYGAAVVCESSDATFSDCIISDNIHSGIYSQYDSRIQIRDCMVSRNEGYGIYCRDATVIADSTVSHNAETGIYCQDDTTVSNCTVSGNKRGIHCDDDNVIKNCIIMENTFGGVIFGGNFSEIINSIIARNTGFEGAGIHCDWNFETIVANCTISGNSSIKTGGGIHCNGSYNIYVSNCILWGNTAPEGPEIYVGTKSSLRPSSFRAWYNDIQGGKSDVYVEEENSWLVWYDGNINLDPQFISSTDYHLQDNSPCIDKGTNNPRGTDLPATDLDGNPRIDNGIVDMGAYEFIHPVKVSVDIKPRACPNPVNVKSKGILPVAILGTDVFDVNDIDISSIRLEGVAPIRSYFEDVATPATDPNECACTKEGPDGYMDLMLKFETQEIIAILGEVIDGEEWLLSLTGTLYDGTEIEGTDCIIIRKKGTKE